MVFKLALGGKEPQRMESWLVARACIFLTQQTNRHEMLARLALRRPCWRRAESHDEKVASVRPRLLGDHPDWVSLERALCFLVSQITLDRSRVGEEGVASAS